jgi:hypothetical protein
MVTGESHYAWGIRRRLSVIERPGRAHVELGHRRMLLYVAEGTSAETRAKVLERWQREELRRAILPLIAAGRPMAHDLRAMVGAIAYVTRNGIEWRAMSADFPPWDSVYAFYRR